MSVQSRLASLRRGTIGVLGRAVGEQTLVANGTRRGWFGGIMAVAWLAYLRGPVHDVWTRGEQARASLAAVCVLAFGALIAGSFVGFRKPDWDNLLNPQPPDRRVWLLFAALTGLTVAMVWLLGPSAMPTAVYIAAVAVFILPVRESGFVALTVAAAMVLLPFTVPSLRLGGATFYLSVIPVVIWVGRQLGLQARRLEEVGRRQRAELAIVEERNRVARDVHDILGHSLTVITVKTELAQRLIDVDLERARAEMADIELLAREALAGVRDTVGGLREVSLLGELANARTALAAADVDANLPDGSTLPDTPHAELFGWVLREAVTNVVRHSAARHCAVTVTDTTVEVVDDGRGLPADAASGSGLSGLRERVRAAGGTMTLSSPEGGGLRVFATMPFAARTA